MVSLSRWVLGVASQDQALGRPLDPFERDPMVSIVGCLVIEAGLVNQCVHELGLAVARVRFQKPAGASSGIS